MNKKVKICFTFIMAGHGHVLITPKSQSLQFTKTGCQEVELEPGHYFIFFNGDSSGGATITVSMQDTIVATRHYSSGIFQDSPIVINV